MSSMNTSKLFPILASAIWIVLGSPLGADAFPSRWVDTPQSSGLHVNSGTETNLAWSVSLDAASATWLRVEFGNCDLGSGSYVRIVSEATQRSHRLNAT